jgi:hypothetical protein
VECASCHNSHLADQNDEKAQGKSKIADPANTWQKFLVVWRAYGTKSGTASSVSDPDSIVAFCERCHVSPSTTAPVSRGSYVPYDVRLVNDSANEAWGDPHDTFTATTYNGSSRHGKGGDLACTACHDFHGSSNAYLLREKLVSPADGSTLYTMTGMNADPGACSDWEKVWNWCASCHQALRGVTPHNKPDCSRNRYQTCFQCHNHAEKL